MSTDDSRVDEREAVIEAVAEAMYEEYRVGSMSVREYRDPWEEIGEGFRQRFRARASNVLAAATRSGAARMGGGRSRVGATEAL